MAQQIEALSGQIRRLREEHEDLRADLRPRVDDLEEVMRVNGGRSSTPRPLSMRATSGTPRASFNLTVVGGSKVTRLRRWFRSAMRRLWEVVYGKPEDS